MDYVWVPIIHLFTLMVTIFPTPFQSDRGLIVPIRSSLYNQSGLIWLIIMMIYLDHKNACIIYDIAFPMKSINAVCVRILEMMHLFPVRKLLR